MKLGPGNEGRVLVPLLDVEELSAEMQQAIREGIAVGFVTCELCDDNPAYDRLAIPEPDERRKTLALVYACGPCIDQTASLCYPDKIALGYRISLKFKLLQELSMVSAMDDSLVTYLKFMRDMYE